MVAGPPVLPHPDAPSPGGAVRIRVQAIWTRHAEPRLRVLVAREHRRLTLPLAGLTVVSSVGTALAPTLLEWPLLLCLLSPRLPFLLLAAHDSPLAVFLLIATVRSCLADPFHFLLGRRMAVTGAPRGAVTRFLTRIGPTGIVVTVLVRPIGRHVFAAGVMRIRPAVVIAADVAGTVAFLIVVHTGMSLW
jgi:hypothetical protein